MFTTILGFLGSTVFGSIIGILGNWINQKTILKAEKVKNEHELAVARVNIEMVTAKTDASIKINKAQIEGAIDLQDSKSYATNLVVANQKSFSDKWINKMFEVKGWLSYIAVPMALLVMGSLALVDVIKGFMRPVLTLAFAGGFGYLTYISYYILKQKGFSALTPAQAVMYFTLALDTCVMLTTTCVVWWFADRRAAKSINRMTERRLRMNDLVQTVEEPPKPDSSKPPVLEDEVTPTDEEE
jgi:hypothetical protein